ncbi:hypothetical protein SAMN05216188_10932 [Lentzea xinjiangensis]|uniref:Uncharacterized protein n=1 Tax=Lentzea xinjiangensis TaxID=402600 RepID=A0A1H9MGR2_9PSEU|nr:hypothetical protein [Lentzea xinjiangensis]SER22363.1 hypothetical protein SAMN05216188_10932 [Lentzea xinjiangensis]
MTEHRPEVQSKRLVRASVLALAIAAGSFLILTVGKAVIVVAFAIAICWIFYVITLANYRPGPSKWAGVTAMVIGIATLFPAHIGGHSLWLATFGETLHCDVVSVESHTHRTSPTTYSNKLQCGDRQLSYHPSMYRSTQQPGTKMDIVVDRTDVVPYLEPDKVTLGHSLLFVLALLMNGVFIFLVAWLPVREPVPAAEEQAE